MYTIESSLEDVRMVGDFVIRLESTKPLVSTATLNDVEPKHNGSVLMCASSASTILQPEQFAQIIVLVKGKLHTQHK